MKIDDNYINTLLEAMLNIETVYFSNKNIQDLLGYSEDDVEKYVFHVFWLAESEMIQSTEAHLLGGILVMPPYEGMRKYGFENKVLRLTKKGHDRIKPIVVSRKRRAFLATFDDDTPF